MNKISIDFSKNKGKIKPMHAVNNGPKISAVDQKSDNKYIIKRRIFRTQERTMRRTAQITAVSIP